MASEKERIVDFLIEASKLKDIDRTGWLMVDVKKPESVAAHIYSVSLMSAILGEKLKVDKQKLLEMVLVHDLCEVYAGDIATRKDGRMYVLKKGKIEKFKGDKKYLEERSMKKILNKLPEELRRKYYKLWREYEDGKTKESKIAHELDKLDYSIQAILYKKRANKKIDRFVDTKRFLRTKYLIELQKIIEKRFDG
ncbi:MAG: HD domain-containing protein [Candidatus Aenigmatarchaeota archaeon]